MGKKKEDYDYSDIHCDEDELREIMKNMAKSIQMYVETISMYAILEGVTEKTWEDNIKTAKKLVKKLKNGDPSVFNVEALNDYLEDERYHAKAY